MPWQSWQTQAYAENLCKRSTLAEQPHRNIGHKLEVSVKHTPLAEVVCTSIAVLDDLWSLVDATAAIRICDRVGSQPGSSVSSLGGDRQSQHVPHQAAYKCILCITGHETHCVHGRNCALSRESKVNPALTYLWCMRKDCPCTCVAHSITCGDGDCACTHVYKLCSLSGTQYQTGPGLRQ